MEDAYVSEEINANRHRFPHCIVWTPIPPLTWLFPIIGHMGIALCSGVIRDFSGSYSVSEDDMAFGWPTSYWQLDLKKCPGGASNWDKSVLEASEEYLEKMHFLCCNNCHSHIARALNLIQYDGKTTWNGSNVLFYFLLRSKYVNFWGWLKQWLPFLIVLSIVALGLILWAVLAQG